MNSYYISGNQPIIFDKESNSYVTGLNFTMESGPICNQVYFRLKDDEVSAVGYDILYRFINTSVDETVEFHMCEAESKIEQIKGEIKQLEKLLITDLNKCVVTYWYEEDGECQFYFHNEENANFVFTFYHDGSHSLRLHESSKFFVHENTQNVADYFLSYIKEERKRMPIYA